MSELNQDAPETTAVETVAVEKESKSTKTATAASINDFDWDSVGKKSAT